MKLLLTLSAITIALQCHAQTVGLEWDAPTDLSRITHYRVVATQGTTTNVVAEVPVTTTKAHFTLACAQDYSLAVFSVDSTIGELSAPSASLPVAMRVSPAPVLNAPTKVFAGQGKWNVGVSWGSIPKPAYATNFFCQLNRPTGGAVTYSTTNTSLALMGLGNGQYQFIVRGDNWCGQGVLSSQIFTISGIGNPNNPRIIP